MVSKKEKSKHDVYKNNTGEWDNKFYPFPNPMTIKKKEEKKSDSALLRNEYLRVAY